MSNHVHIVIKIQKEFLSKMMKVLEMRYSVYLNKKMDRVGHLFEDRFFSKKIENIEYFKACCKYIHRNPEKAGIEKTENYKWSSYNDYIQKKDNFTDISVLLYYFNDNLEEFNKYNLENNDIEELFEFGEFEIRTKLTDNETAEIIKIKYNLENSMKISFMKENERNEIIENLKKIKGTSIEQISRITGVSTYWIKKIWKNK